MANSSDALDTPATPGSKAFIRKEFQIFANQKLTEARFAACSKAGEIRRLFSTGGVSFSETRFIHAKLCDLFELLPEGSSATLDTFLRAADALREEDRMNNNASPEPELFSTPLPFTKNSDGIIGLPPKAPKLRSTKKHEGGIFPSAKQMSTKVSPSICSGKSRMDVYQFVGSSCNVPITPKQKAPRTLKPGEIVFSQIGSPIYVPTIPNTDSKQFPSTPGNNAIGVDRPVRLQVPDVKGMFDVDLVYRGDPNDPGDANRAQAFRGFVTDIRGLISTRSTVRSSKRLMDLRVPVKSKSVKSASKTSKKKPHWLQ